MHTVNVTLATGNYKYMYQYNSYWFMKLAYENIQELEKNMYYFGFHDI